MDIGIELPRDGTLLEHAQHELEAAVTRQIGSNWATSVALYPAAGGVLPRLMGRAEDLCERYVFWFFLWQQDRITLKGVQEPDEAVITPRSEPLIYPRHERNLNIHFFRVLEANRLLFVPREHYWRDVRLYTVLPDLRRATEDLLRDLAALSDAQARITIFRAVLRQDLTINRYKRAVAAAQSRYGEQLEARPALFKQASTDQLRWAFKEARRQPK
jgi:hypothetical protein